MASPAARSAATAPTARPPRRPRSRRRNRPGNPPPGLGVPTPRRGRGKEQLEGRPLEDAELVELARDGDVRAYGELVERYRDVAFRAAYLIARNAADAEDAAQDAFVKAYYALGRFRSGEPFRPWILRIVSNEAKNRRRSAGRRERLALRLAERRGPGDAAPSPDAAALGHESRAVLLAALEELPERDRLVIAYRYLLDLSEAETSAALGVRAGTVKSRLFRALGRLRAALPEGFAPPGDTDD